MESNSNVRAEESEDRGLGEGDLERSESNNNCTRSSCFSMNQQCVIIDGHRLYNHMTIKDKRLSSSEAYYSFDRSRLSKLKIENAFS